jgi:hypothetical protein
MLWQDKTVRLAYFQKETCKRFDALLFQPLHSIGTIEKHSIGTIGTISIGTLKDTA